MAVSDVEAVLDFLRKNGLAEAESALKVDIHERGDLGLFDFEKFEFPISPSLPTLRIQNLSEDGNANGGGVDSGGDEFDSSSDDFLTMGSNNSSGSLSEFTNPYGLRSLHRGRSEASSDRLSEFDTARDYHDPDILNDMYWHDEKDQDYLKYSTFGGTDFLICTSEDKFVTTSETGAQYAKPSGLNFASEGFHSMTSIDCLSRSCFVSNTSMDYVDDMAGKDCYHWDEMIQSQRGIEAGLGTNDDNYKSSVHPCDCCTELQQCYGRKIEDCQQPISMKESNIIDTQLRRIDEVPFGCDSMAKNEKHESSVHSTERCLPNNFGEDLFENEFDSHVVDENSYPDYEDEGKKIEDSKENIEALEDTRTAGDGDECSTPNELRMYDTQEDDYEVFNLRIVHRKNKTGFEENKDLPIVLNTIIAGRYYVTEYLGSAAFSKVVQAHDLHTGVEVCLKIIKNDKDFFDQSLDEVKLLKFVNKNDPADEHHILRLYDYFYHQEHLFIVCELLRANLYEFQKYNQDSGGEVYFTLRRLQIITRQCLEALEYLHQLGIIHCDLKPENILIKSYSRCEIKVIDLGSSCFQTDNLCLYVQSRSYRAPEVILGCPYNEKIDIWSLGCILAELCSGEVLFPNESLVILLARMIGMCGPIDMEMLVNGQETHKYFTKEYELYLLNEETDQMDYIIPEESSLENHLQVSDTGFIEFINVLLETNPSRRPTASEALQNPWLSYVYE